jgi:chromosome segregation ATPase
MVSFPETDIEYALQAEIDSLKEQVSAYQCQNRELKEDLDSMVRRDIAKSEQERYLRQSLKEAEDKLTQRASTVMTWAKRAVVAERECERLKVIEAAHHRVIDALWGGEKSPAVGKERGSERPKHPVSGGCGRDFDDLQHHW